MLVEISMNNCAKYQNQTYIFLNLKNQIFHFVRAYKGVFYRNFLTFFLHFFYLCYTWNQISNRMIPPPPVLN